MPYWSTQAIREKKEQAALEEQPEGEAREQRETVCPGTTLKSEELTRMRPLEDVKANSSLNPAPAVLIARSVKTPMPCSLTGMEEEPSREVKEKPQRVPEEGMLVLEMSVAVTVLR